MKPILCIIILIILMPITAFAQELPAHEQYLPNEVADILSEEWLAAFGIGNQAEIGTLFKKVSEIFCVQLTEALQAGTLLFGMLILVSMCSQYAQSLSRTNTTNTVQLASLLCFGILGYTLLSAVWRAVGQALSVMETIMRAMVPSITALTLAGGNSTTAGIYAVGAAWLVGGMEALLTGLLYPAMHACYGMLLIAGVSTEEPLGELAKWVQKWIVLLLGTGMGILALVLSVQSAIAQSADSVTAKTMKFAIGSTVPFVGSAVGESIRTVVASMGYLRSVVGFSAIIALVAILFPVALNVVLYKVIFSFVGALSNVVGCKTEGKLLCGISDILNIAIAILVSCFLCSVVLLALFAKTTVAFA